MLSIIENRWLIYLFLNYRKIMQELSNPQRSKTNGRWTQEEHLIFLEGLRVYGKNWKQIENLLKTRTGTQIRSHAQKFFMKIEEGNARNEGEGIHSGGDFLQKESLHDSQKLTNTNPPNIEQTTASYYLSKILEYSHSQGIAGFWNALVDQKQHTTHNKLNYCKPSFQLYNQYNKHPPQTLQ